MKAIIFLSLIALVLCSETFPKFPLFKQCDSRWGSQTLGFGPDTICKAGCAMSSLTMILNGYGIKVSGSESTPSTVNTWLKSHGGYVSGDLLVWGAVDPLGVKFQSFLQPSQIVSQWKAGRVIILNVNKGGHYVLMTGVSSDGKTFNVNDPGYSKSTYTYSEITRGVEYRPPSTIEQKLI